MSHHEGITCDSCMKENFHGHRYKCLICFDYDLCASCYEAGLTTMDHESPHSMQCILTESDFELYYGGEGLTVEQPQSFCCPYCSKMGFIERTLQKHIATYHCKSSSEVICPICAALPEENSNHVTDDFLSHLTQEHQELCEFQEEPLTKMKRKQRLLRRGIGRSPSRYEDYQSQLFSLRRRVADQIVLLKMKDTIEGISKKLAESVKPVDKVIEANTILDSPGDMQSDKSVNFHNNSHYLLATLEENTATEYEKQTYEVESADQSLFVCEILLSTLSDITLL